MTNVLSVTYVFPTEAEANAKANELETKGFTVFVPCDNPAALPTLTGSTNQLLLDFHAVDAKFPVGGIQFTDAAGDGAIETIVNTWLCDPRGAHSRSRGRGTPRWRPSRRALRSV